MNPMLVDVDPPIWQKTYLFETTRYAISDDESVMAIVTEDSAVQLLRTSDLKVLATQRISSSSSGEPCIDLRFITASNDWKSSGKDILVIFVSESSTPFVEEDSEQQQQHSQQPCGRTSFIIVSGIDGGLLNSLDKNTFAKASSALKVSHFDIILNYTTLPGQHVNLGGCYLYENVVRILVACSNGLVTAYDYDVASCQLSTEKAQSLESSSTLLFSHSKDSLTCIPECQVDFSFHPHVTLFTLAIECNDIWGILWCDVKSLRVVGEYCIPKKREKGKIISCLSVVAINQRCIAAVVAFKRDEGIFMETIQATISSTEPTTTLNEAGTLSEPIGSHPTEDMLVISNFHTVFCINVGTSDDPKSADICSFQMKQSSIHDPFHFQYWFMQNSKLYCKEFIPGDGAVVGKFRLLLALKSYDDAETLIEETGSSSSSFGSMHISEVALHNFKSLLVDGDPVSKTSMERAKHLLRQLAHGAVSGGQAGVESLISASTALYHLPDDDTLKNKLLTTKEYRRALVAMSSTIQSALLGVSRSYAKQLEDQTKVINEKIDALNCLDMFPELLQDFEDRSWIAIKTPKDLFSILISRGYLSAAMRLKDLDCCRVLIDTETMVMAIIQIKATVDPEVYIDWVRNVLLQMKLNDPLVSIILNWAHRMADALDEDNNKGIDASLVLLSSINAALVQMFGRIHKSFANILERDSAPACTSSDPTVMRVNFIRGYGAKTINSLVSKRMRNYNAGAQDDDMEDGDYFSLIETKLFNAQALKEARMLGLGTEHLKMMQLRTASGSIILARALLMHFFNKAEFDLINVDVQSYCAKFRVDFDQVIIFCVNDLCDGKAKYLHKMHDIVALAQLTKSPDAICDLALRICRMASLSDVAPECVFAFANDAMYLALSEGIRSELKEALRLLVINDIIGRYCGISARELFNISDVRHASRLLDFVCSHVSSPEILTDALALCDAFTHLSKLDACVVIMQRTILRLLNTDTSFLSDAKPIESLSDLNGRMIDMEQNEFINNRTQSLDGGVCSKRRLNYYQSAEHFSRLKPSITSRVCEFCSELLEELRRRLQETTASKDVIRFKSMMKLVCLLAIGILTNALESSTMQNDRSTSSYETLLRSFRRLEKLQGEHDLFITVADLKSTRLVQRLIEQMFSTSSLIDIFAVKNMGVISCEKRLPSRIEHVDFEQIGSLRPTIFKAKRLCNLFFASPQESTSMFFLFTGKLTAETLMRDDVDPFVLFLFLEECGLSKHYSSTDSAAIFMQLAMSLCRSVVLDIRHTSKSDYFETFNRGDILSTIKKCLCASNILKECTILHCSPQLLPVAMHSFGALDIISCAFQQVDSRIGEIVGTYHRDIGASADQSLRISMMPSSIAVLKPSWYADDGLFLPPLDALKCSVEFLGSALLSCSAAKSQNQLPEVDNMARLLISHGAFFLTFRLITFTSALSAGSSGLDSEQGVAYGFHEILHQVIKQLAERSLGTAGGGIISGEIDSQLAMAYVLILPLKTALKVLSSSLPSSISRRDFIRLLKLTAVGLRACGQYSMYDDEDLIQKTGNIRWGHDVSFVQRAQDLAAKARWWSILQRLDLDFDPQTFFSQPGYSGSSLTNGSDQMSGSGNCSKLVDAFIARAFMALKIPLTVHCLMKNYSKSFGVDIVSLIETFISYLLTVPSSGQKPDTKISGVRMDLKACETAVKQMLDLVPDGDHRTSILRRCLVMMENADDSGTDYERYHLILSIYAVELSKSLSHYDNPESPPTELLDELLRVRQRKDVLHILASYFQGNKMRYRPMLQKFFKPLGENDPITPSTLNTSLVLGATESTNPISFDPLTQIEHYFRETHDYSAVSALAPICIPLSLPSGFVHARSLMARIKRAKDMGNKPFGFKTEIHPVIKRLNYAKDASVFAQWCAAQYPEDTADRLECLELAETLAFDAAKELELDESGDSGIELYKTMRCEKAALKDTLCIQAELNRPSSSPADSILGRISKDAHTLHKDSKFIPPEILAENLLVSGAKMVAEASLSDTSIFTPNDFRFVASSVHKACRLLQYHHSHVELGYICKKLAIQLITHADNEIKSEQGIKRFYESREDSELKDTAVGLRVAFVLSFCESFHQKHQMDDLTNKASRLAKSRGTESRESELAMNHARFLLKISFGKSSGLLVNDVLTFAMRHRALRAARVLCPEDVLLIIIHQDLGLSVEGVDMGTFLRKCCFGCFVAKEVESMGLNLPSSDLITFSFMDYASFARVLWRQYGRVDQSQRSRFLRLLLDLARSNDSFMDTEFMSAIQRELDSLKFRVK